MRRSDLLQVRLAPLAAGPHSQGSIAIYLQWSRCTRKDISNEERKQSDDRARQQSVRGDGITRKNCTEVNGWSVSKNLAALTEHGKHNPAFEVSCCTINLKPMSASTSIERLAGASDVHRQN